MLCLVVISLLFALTGCAATRSQSSDVDARQLNLEALLDFERHAESIWRDVSDPQQPENSGFWGNGVSDGNAGIRGSCGVAVAYAVLVHARPDDPENARRISRLTKALNYAANTHRSGDRRCVDGKTWGHGWQTAEWAGSMGLACMLAQKLLPEQTVRDVQRALADEATYRAGVPPATGYLEDTKSEENGWNSNALALAAAWMSTHADASLWLDAAKKYLVNTYTVSDKSGDPLAEWISTVTLFPGYALENHGFYHPTYAMVGGMSLGDSYIMAWLANTNVARELQPFAEHNVLELWTNNLQYMLTDSSDFAYPSGLDWELHDYEHNSYLTWLATHFNDPVARWAEPRIAQLIRERQKVNGDGRFVGESVNNGFFREAVEARRTAIAWLFQTYARFPEGPSMPPPAALVHFPDVKLIAHRTPSSFFGLSFGRRIMGYLEPTVPPGGFPTNVFMTSPRLPGMIALGALGNPTSAELIAYSTNEHGFEVELKVQNGTNGFTRVWVTSTGESVAIVEQPVPAKGFTPSRNLSSRGSFTVGIENDPLIGGHRTLKLVSGSMDVTNRSGVTLNLNSPWVCIDDRYAMVAGPEGDFRYQAPGRYNRSGGAEDSLAFQPTDPMAPRYAVWFPGKTARETAELARRIAWRVTENRAELQFPGAGRRIARIAADLTR